MVITTAGLIAGSLITVVASGRTAGPTERGKALETLIEAERSFSRTSEERGIREAFLTWLAPGSVVFRPEPMDGREVYLKTDPFDPAVLTWEPEVAEVSASGDLGYTSGPYVYRPGRRMEPTAFGHYVSVWVKRPDGSWKVKYDVGVTYPRKDRPGPAEEVATPAADKRAAALSPERLRDEEYAFGQTASQFVRTAAVKGLRKTLARFGTDDIRIYRPGRPPSVGKARISRTVRDYAGHIMAIDRENKAELTVGMAWSADLAYSYGTTFFYDTPRHQSKLVIFRIWRRDPSGEWKICLDLELPAPTPS
jgi:ketosteroid isomerase-like protein